MIFAQELKRHRERNDLTQSKLIELLIDYDESFSTLDLTTLSRWERRITSPSLAKKILIFRFFNTDLIELLTPYSLTTPNKDKLSRHLARTINPYLSGIKQVKISNIAPNNEKYRKILRFNDNFLKIPTTKIYKINDKLHIKSILSSENELVGHLVYGFSSAQNETTSIEIDSSMLDKKIELHQDRSILNIISAYSAISSARTILTIEILNIALTNPYIKAVLHTFQFQEAYSFIEHSVKHTILERGEEMESEGVKVSGKHYKYIRVLFKVEDLLATKSLIDLVINQEMYLKELLLPDQKIES